MVKVEDLAMAMLARDALTARSLLQDLLRSGVDLAQYPDPEGVSSPVRTMTAAIVELLLSRRGCPAPAWTQRTDRLPEPFFTNALALRSARLRAQDERESPEPLRRRNIFAGANVLTSA